MFAVRVRFVLLLTSCIASDVNILHMFRQYCSKSLDCPLEHQAESNFTETDTDECCLKCSCSEQCGMTQSCCFVEDNIDYVRKQGKECIEPFIGDVNHFLQLGGYGFVMVTTCLDRDEECKYKNVTLNVSPVESTSSEVFINEECARCNKVNNFVRWNVRILSTGQYSYSFRNMDEPTNNIETIIYNSPTTVSHHTCYKTFVPVDISNCPNELYKQACASVVLPFFTYLGTFKNVFCFLCFSPKTPSCDLSNGRETPGGISLLLNNKLDVTTIAAYFSRDRLQSNDCPDGYMPHPARVGTSDIKYIIARSFRHKHSHFLN